MTLAEKLVAVHRALVSAGVPHAFGGAIALAYWTLDPRGTSDIDVNLFVPAADAADALGALPAAITLRSDTLARIERDGQARVWWEETPVDLFFDTVPLHAAAAAHRQVVPFTGVEIPILGPVELAVFKALFDRTKDWADIEAMLVTGTLADAELRDALTTLLPTDDPRLARVADAARRAAAGG